MREKEKRKNNKLSGWVKIDSIRFDVVHLTAKIRKLIEKVLFSSLFFACFSCDAKEMLIYDPTYFNCRFKMPTEKRKKKSITSCMQSEKLEFCWGRRPEKVNCPIIHIGNGRNAKRENNLNQNSSSILMIHQLLCTKNSLAVTRTQNTKNKRNIFIQNNKQNHINRLDL